MTANAEKQDLYLNNKISITRVNPNCTHASALLLIHGWGASSDIWQGCIESLQQEFDIYLLDLPGHSLNKELFFSSVEDFVDQFKRQHFSTLPSRFSIIGWSLGGLLASFLAQEFSDRVTSLVTVATNRRFVSDDIWLHAMPDVEFKKFNQQLSAIDQQSVLNRFYVLQTQGVPSTRNDLRNIKSLLSQATYSLAGLQQGLAWLASYDLLSCWDALAVPTLHQFGARDNLVPHDAASLLADRYPDRALKIFQSSAHLPFISERENWLASTVGFIRANSLQAIKKDDIEKSFSNAAKSYDALAVFQHQVGRQLMSYLPANSARRVLDLGAGTGYFSESLRAHYSAADIVELDISFRMLASCQERAASDFQVQADIEALPFEHNSFDVVFSNLSIQWCHDLDNVFKGLADVLVDGGTAVLTTLVDGSLFELKQAWSNVDDAVHVNVFDNELKVKASCEQSGLKLQQWLVEDDVQTFLTLQDLIQSVKNIGAHNMHPNRPKGLMGKNKYRQFVNAYSALQTSEGELPLTYRILYMVLKK